MFRFKRDTIRAPKKRYSLLMKVTASGKPIAEFRIYSEGHSRRQAINLANEKLALKVVKATLVKPTK